MVKGATDSTPPKPHTVLPPLNLRGVQTPLVESLSYYYDRMLWTTGLTSAEVAQLIRPWCMPSRMKKFDFRTSSPVPEDITTLEMLTGQDDLRFGTLWALSDVLSVNANLYGRQRRRWCPMCLEHWGEASYEPLVWGIDLIGCCSVHECRLEYTCFTCGAVQTRVRDLELRRLCSACGKRLGHQAKCTRLPDFLMWVDKQVLELVEYCATPRKRPMAWSEYERFIHGLRMNVRDGEMARVPMRPVLRDFYKSAIHRSWHPTIRSLINLCAVQGISMNELLNAPDESSGPKLFDQWSGLPYLPLPTAYRAQRIYVATRLIAYLLSRRPSYVPPLHLVLRPIRVLEITVRDASPEAYRDYEVLYLNQGGSGRLNDLKRSYLAAMHALASRGREGGATTILDMIVDVAQLAIPDAIRVLDGAYAVIDAYADYRIESYEKELPVRSAVEWVVGKWGERIYGQQK